MKSVLVVVILSTIY